MLASSTTNTVVYVWIRRIGNTWKWSKNTFTCTKKMTLYVLAIIYFILILKPETFKVSWTASPLMPFHHDSAGAGLLNARLLWPVFHIPGGAGRQLNYSQSPSSPSSRQIFQIVLQSSLRYQSDNDARRCSVLALDLAVKTTQLKLHCPWARSWPITEESRKLSDAPEGPKTCYICMYKFIIIY